MNCQCQTGVIHYRIRPFPSPHPTGYQLINLTTQKVEKDTPAYQADPIQPFRKRTWGRWHWRISNLNVLYDQNMHFQVIQITKARERREGMKLNINQLSFSSHFYLHLENGRQPNEKQYYWGLYTHWDQTVHPLPLLLKQNACKHLISVQSTVLFLAAGTAEASCFSPQNLTDALEGYNSSPSDHAREMWSNVRKTEMCVYHCQNSYTVWHLHDGKLCQFVKNI